MTTVAAPPAPAKKSRGKQTVFDMLRSMAVIMAIVVPVWYFGQADPSDSKRVRPVDTTGAVNAFASSMPLVPAPHTVPTGFVPTVTDSADSVLLRIGYVVGKDDYAEWIAGQGAQFGKDLTGDAASVAQLQISGATWTEARSSSGALSLVRQVHGTTVIVGGVRQKGTLVELEQLAGSLT